MSNMQAFHDWLSSPAAVNTPYRRCLNGLTQMPRSRLANLVQGYTWVIWNSDQATA